MTIGWHFDNSYSRLPKKGCVCLSGVSLTVNQVDGDKFSVCLIPETLKRTNLHNLRTGDLLNIEADYLAKSLVRASEVTP